MSFETVGMVTTEAALRAIVPEPSPKVRLKILDRLERHSQRIIELAGLSALASATRFEVVAQRGAIKVENDGRTLRIPDRFPVGPAIGGLFVVPGIEETLRVNGRVIASGELEVEEVFLQCPKAFVRSKLWDQATWTGTECTVESSPFALVATEGSDGRGDVSPRGDPPGFFVRRLDERTLLLPDRTGNHLVDTLRNVIHRPRATLVFMTPGCADVLIVAGSARITSDRELLAPSAVKGKAPKLGIVLDIQSEILKRNALAGFWSAESLVDPKDFPTMGEMILDQVNPGGRVLNAIGAKIFDIGNGYHKRRRLY